MIRQTSVEAYRRIEAEGLLSEARWKVYNALYEFGPCTGGELFLKMNGQHIKGSVCARLTELRDMGVAAEIGVKTCRMTGETAIAWDVTSAIPKPLPRNVRLSSKEKIARLESQVRRQTLKSEIYREMLIDVYRLTRGGNTPLAERVEKAITKGRLKLMAEGFIEKQDAKDEH